MSTLPTTPLSRLPAPANGEGPQLPSVPRSLPELGKALAAAQEKCQPVEKNGEVKFNKVQYRYPTAQAILAEAGRAMQGTGLTMVPAAPRLIVLGTPPHVVYMLEQDFLLLHASGESLSLGRINWPVCPDNGRAVDKAYAAAQTTALAYMYRGILRMPHADPADDIAGRDDTPAKTEAAPPRTPAPPAPPAPAVETLCIDEVQAQALKALIRETGTDARKLCAAYKVPVIDKLPAAVYGEIHKKLTDRKQVSAKSPTTPAPLPTLSNEQTAHLVKIFSAKKLPLADWVTSLGAETIGGIPAVWFRWVCVQANRGADVHQLEQDYKVKRLSEIPLDRLEGQARAALMAHIDQLVGELDIPIESWNQRLLEMFNTTDSTALNNEQLEKLQLRLMDYKAKKAAQAGAA